MKEKSIKKTEEKKKYPVWFYLILLSIPFFFFIFVEIGLRGFNYGKNYNVFIELSDNYPGVLFFNPEVPYKYFTNISTPPSVIPDGFTKEKKENCFRVFVMGESSTAGWPYVPNANLSRHLLRRLKLFFPESDIEVINMGMSAVNTYTIRDLIPAVIEQQPDLILFYNGHNEYYGSLGVGSSQSLTSSRTLINLYITLQDYRIFQLLREFINWTSSLFINSEKIKGSGQNETLMERMVGESLIPINSPIYNLGIEQFEENMRDILRMTKNAGIPVILGTLISNIKDLEPFVSVHDSDNTEAINSFNKGKEELNSSNFDTAKKFFYEAKDLDAIRFRAPSRINEIIINLSWEFGCSVVDFDSIFNTISPQGITGYNLTVDHLHPNVEGYQILGKFFFEKMRELNMLPKSKQKQIESYTADSLMKSELPFTELDSAIAQLRINILIGSYPFVPKGKENELVKNFQPKNLIDTLAIEVVDRWTTWEKAHYSLADYYYAKKEYEKAKREIAVLIEDRPMNTAPYFKLINMLVAAKLYDEAAKYLNKLNSINPGAFTYKWLGSIELERKNYQQAANLLKKSLDYSQNDAQVWYNLSGALTYLNQLESALNALERCLALDPNHQLARSFYNQLRPMVRK